MNKKNIWLINQYSYPPGKSGWRRHFDLFRYFDRGKYVVLFYIILKNNIY